MSIFAANFYNVQISFKYSQNYCQMIFVCVEQVFSVLEHVLASGSKFCGPPCIYIEQKNPPKPYPWGVRWCLIF
jgi:hypothetical protein